MKKQEAKAPAPASSTWAAWMSLAAGTTHHLTTGMIHFLPALYALKLGASPIVVGLIPAAHSLPGILSALPGGRIVDRLGSRRVVRVTTLCRIFIILIYLRVSSPIWLTVPSFFSGALATVTVVSLHTYISEISMGGRRRKEMSRFALTASIGELLGPAVGGALVDHFSFHTAFIAAALLCMLSWVAAFLLPQTGATEKPDRHDTAPQLLGFRGLMTDPGVQAALWGTGLFASLQSFLRGFLPVLLYAKYSATEIGSVFFVASAASLLGRSALGWKSERWSLFQVLPACVIVTASPIILLPFLSNYMLIAVTMAVFGVGQGLLAVLGTVLIAECVAAEERGLANGLRLTTMRVGAVAGPALFGSLTGLFAVGVAFAAIGGMSVAAALFLSWSGVLTRAQSAAYQFKTSD